jgi:hypothetical protein
MTSSTIKMWPFYEKQMFSIVPKLKFSPKMIQGTKFVKENIEFS